MGYLQYQTLGWVVLSLWCRRSPPSTAHRPLLHWPWDKTCPHHKLGTLEGFSVLVHSHRCLGDKAANPGQCLQNSRSLWMEQS